MVIDISLLKNQSTAANTIPVKQTNTVVAPQYQNRDLSIIRQSSVKAAVEYAHGRPISIDDVLKVAEKIEAWVLR